MKQDNINYLAVGAFVLAMLVLLLFGLYEITGQRADTDTYTVTMQNVSGIREGTTVTYSGFQIGQVQSIQPIRKKGRTTYKLTLAIRPDWPIPVDSEAQVVMPSLLGEKQIDITEGQAQALLKPGQQIKSVEAVDMVNLMSSISTEFQQLSQHGLLPLLRNLNTQISETVPAVTADARRLMDNLNTSAVRLSEILNAANQKKLNNIITNAETMTDQLSAVSERLNKTGDQIDALVGSASTMMGDNQKDIRKVVTDLRTSMDAVTSRIDSIMYNLDSTSRNLNEFSRQVRDNPGALINSNPPPDMTETHQ
jgi:phospholipid/cholesterol/gamma-HCH transport system substrate-binding protein